CCRLVLGIGTDRNGLEHVPVEISTVELDRDSAGLPRLDLLREIPSRSAPTRRLYFTDFQSFNTCICEIIGVFDQLARFDFAKLMDGSGELDLRTRSIRIRRRLGRDRSHCRRTWRRIRMG